MKKQTIIIDSSVFLSLYLQDEFYTEAYNIIYSTLDTHTVLMPDIVFCEIINVLYREGIIESKIKLIINDLSKNGIKVTHLDENFWKFHFLNLVKKVRIKSNDFLILAHSLYYEVDLFVTFDQKLNIAYKSIRNEKN